MFIIVGILVLIGVLLAIYTSNNAIEEELDTAVLKTLTVPAEFEPIKAYVENCITEKTLESLSLIGFQGGLVNTPVDQPRLLYSSDDFEIPFWYYNGEDASISDGEVAAQIDSYLNDTLRSCINDFAGLNYNIEDGMLDPFTRIVDTAIVVDLEYPVKVILADKEYSHSRFVVTVPTRFRELLNAAHAIVQEELVNPNELDLNMLSDLGVDVLLNEYAEDILIITLRHKSELLDDEPMSLNFANKYNFSLGPNNDPILYGLNDFEARLGDEVEIYAYAYDLENDDLTFKLYSPYFDIDSTGLIKFTVDEYMIGNQSVTVMVEDNAGGHDSVTFNINFYEGDYTPPANQAPVLDIPGVIDVPGGSLFIYQVLASDPDGDDLYFTDSLPMFDISDDGLIAYVPIGAGEWTGDITVTDGELSDSKSVTFQQS